MTILLVGRARFKTNRLVGSFCCVALLSCSDPMYPENTSIYAGIYDTVVQVISNPCHGYFANDRVTEIRHNPGTTAFTLLHGIQVYRGVVNPDETFTAFGGLGAGDTDYSRRMTGKFIDGGFTADVVADVILLGPELEPSFACKQTMHLEGARR